MGASVMPARMYLRSFVGRGTVRTFLFVSATFNRSSSISTVQLSAENLSGILICDLFLTDNASSCKSR